MSARGVVITVAIASVATLLAVARGAGVVPSRSTLEIWGLGPGDTLLIDGAPVGLRTGLARGFTGQPLPEDASARLEVAAGTHTLVLRRGPCSERSLRVETQGGYKRSLIFAPVSTAHCAIPELPPRAR